LLCAAYGFVFRVTPGPVQDRNIDEPSD